MLGFNKDEVFNRTYLSYAESSHSTGVPGEKPIHRMQVNGYVIEYVQAALRRLGYNFGTIDGLLGPTTRSVLRQFQVDIGIHAHGNLDGHTFAALGMKFPPYIWDRVFQFTMAMENHGFGKASGNHDDMGISWGAFGFNLGSRSLQPILLRIDKEFPSAIEASFGPLASKLRSVLDMDDKDEQIAWGASISIDKGANIKAPWRKAFQKLGTYSFVQAVQLEAAKKEYLGTMGSLIAYPFARTELVWAMLFDIQIQNYLDVNEREKVMDMAKKKGLMDKQYTNLVSLQRASKAFREILLAVTVEGADEAYRKLTCQRKMLFVNGAGTFRKSYWNLAQWGITDAIIPIAFFESIMDELIEKGLSQPGASSNADLNSIQ